MSVTAYHFWSPTCAPCEQLKKKPAFQDLKDDFEDIQWVMVNVQEDPNNYVKEFDVRGWPTIVVVAKNDSGEFKYVGKESGTDVTRYYRIFKSGRDSLRK